MERYKGHQGWVRRGWISERVEQAEMLDLGLGTDQDVADNLAEMQRINDLLGGTRMLIHHLFARLVEHKRPVTILDLGTGGGGLPLAIVHKARRLHDLGKLPLIKVLAVDRSARILKAAARNLVGIPETILLQADALCLPFSHGRFDYVISSLFMHHFPPPQLHKLLRQSYDLAGKGIVMSDLVRGQAPYLAFKLAQPILARNQLTRHDGPLSIRRAYTPGELRRLALDAGLPEPRIVQHWPWRMILIVDKRV